MCNCNKTGSAPKTNTQSRVSILPFSSSLSKRKKTRTSPKVVQKEIQQNTFTTESLDGGTFAEKCQTFGYVLGLDVPVPENVLVAALEDAGYAKSLLMHRGSSHMYVLLNNPPQKLSTISTSSLISKAGKALLQWGLSGFPTVSKVTLKKREDACLACPNLSAPASVLQKITASSNITDETGRRTGNKVCGLCGCVVRNKMRLETETCPDEVKETPGINRWGEIITM